MSMDISKAARRISEYEYRKPYKDEPAWVTKQRKKSYTRIRRILREEEEFTSMNKVTEKFFPANNANMKATMKSVIAQIRGVLAHPYVADIGGRLNKWINELEKGIEP